MTMQQLYYFKKIAELKNYTKAAQELMISQSSLSHSMASLERELDAPLFIKSGRNIDISPHGKIFLAHVNKIIEEYERSRQEIKQSLNPFVGRVRLAFAHTLSHSFIPQMIKDYSQQHDNRAVEFVFLEIEATAQAFVQMDNDEVDLGFGAKIDKAGYSYFEVMKEELIAIVPENHPLAKKINVTLDEICQEPFVSYDCKCGTRHDVNRIFKEHGVYPERMYEGRNEKIIASMVSSGLGVSIMPRIKEINIYQVVPITLEHHKLNRSLYMFWQDNRFLSPVVEHFRKFVIESVTSRNQMNRTLL